LEHIVPREDRRIMAVLFVKKLNRGEHALGLRGIPGSVSSRANDRRKLQPPEKPFYLVIKAVRHRDANTPGS